MLFVVCDCLTFHARWSLVGWLVSGGGGGGPLIFLPVCFSNMFCFASWAKRPLRVKKSRSERWRDGVDWVDAGGMKWLLVKFVGCVGVLFGFLGGDCFGRGTEGAQENAIAQSGRLGDEIKLVRPSDVKLEAPLAKMRLTPGRGPGRSTNQSVDVPDQ